MIVRRTLFRTAALFGVLAVIFGAFGAHALSGKISNPLLEAWKTGVQYQFFHVFALLFISIARFGKNNKWIDWASLLFVAGIILFSGSLYTLAILELLNHSLRPIGILTPIGGFLFIAGWISLFMAGKSA